MSNRLHLFRAAATVVLSAVVAGCGQTEDEVIPAAPAVTTGAYRSVTARTRRHA